VIRAVISVVLLCFAAALAYSMRKNRNNPNSVYAKTLFRFKSVRFFPVLSLVYAFFAAVILFFALLIADEVNGFARYIREDNIVTMMTFEKYGHLAGKIIEGTDCPLVMIRDGTPIPQKENPRILVVGDSFVWGHGISNINHIWWNIASSELARRGYDCDIYAAGFPGASTYDELLWLRDTAVLEAIRPDLIVLGYFINDPDLASLGLGLKTHYPAIYRYDFTNRNWFHMIFPGLYYFLDFKLMEKIGRTENRFNNGDYGYSYWTEVQKYTESPYAGASGNTGKRHQFPI